MTGFRPGARRAPLGCGRPGRACRGPVGIRSRAGPCRPSASVTRREKPGQTRSRDPICSRAGRPPAGPGAQPLYCASCDPTTHARVSLRDRRDARSHTDHLLCHPDVRRPAVQGPAAVDGAHAGARPVRPRRQADAALRHVQARRYRRVHAAARLGSRRTTRRSSSASSASAATRSRSATASVFINGTELDEPITSTRSPTKRPSRRPCRATSTAGSSRRASSS